MKARIIIELVVDTEAKKIAALRDVVHEYLEDGELQYGISNKAGFPGTQLEVLSTKFDVTKA